MNILKLFFEFLKIGAFSFGGGMSTLPYIYEMSDKTGWITEEYVNNILTLSQITPGPLACNIGTIVGFNVCGIKGSIIANIAFVIPAICFAGFSYKFIEKIKQNEKVNEIIKIVRAAALAILITSSITVFKNAFFYNVEKINYFNFIFFINYKSIFLAVLLYFFEKIKKLNTLYLMGFSAIIAGIFNI